MYTICTPYIRLTPSKYSYVQIFALLGHNGAGKTTAIRMMSGMTGMTAGSVDVAGYSVSHQTSKVR